MIVFGELERFGALSGTAGTDYILFSGSGAISSVRSAWPQRWTPRWINPLTQAVGAFPVDTAGLTSVPFGELPQLAYDYILLAPASYSDGAAFSAIQDNVNSIYGFIRSTYTLDGVSGVSGQRGWLVSRHPNPAISTRYKAQARVLEGPSMEFVKGQPSELHLVLTFGLLSDFSIVT